MNQKVYVYLEALTDSFSVRAHMYGLNSGVKATFQNGVTLEFVVKGDDKYLLLLANRQQKVLNSFELCEELKEHAFGDPEALKAFDQLAARAKNWDEEYK